MTIEHLEDARMIERRAWRGLIGRDDKEEYWGETGGGR
jgi:hypothetical protein